MAYFNHAAAKYKKECEEEYEKLKTFIRKNNPKAYEHIKDMEFKIRQQEESLNKYRDFFISLKQFI